MKTTKFILEVEKNTQNAREKKKWIKNCYKVYMNRSMGNNTMFDIVFAWNPYKLNDEK